MSLAVIKQIAIDLLFYLVHICVFIYFESLQKLRKLYLILPYVTTSFGAGIHSKVRTIIRIEKSYFFTGGVNE